MSYHAFPRLNSHLLHRSSRFFVQARSASGAAPQRPSAGAKSKDFRPPWVYRTSALLRVVLIPSAVLYAVLYHDFGEGDHVFMPPRRWIKKQRAKFFPSAIVEASHQDAQLSSVSPPQDPVSGPSSQSS